MHCHTAGKSRSRAVAALKKGQDGANDLNPEVQRIVLLDGPAVLGDPSQWPSQNSCLQATKQTVERLIAQGALKRVDAEAAARLVNGAALNAALWIAASEDPKDVLPKAVEAFRYLASGLLAKPAV